MPDIGQGTAPRLPAPEVWARARARETGRDPARDAAVAALDPALHERAPIENLARMARRQPDRMAVGDSGRAITYGALWRLTVANVAAIVRSGARGGSPPAGPVAVLARDAPLAAAALLACQGAGRVCVPLDPTSPAERNAAIALAAGVTLLAHAADEPDAAAIAAAILAAGGTALALADPLSSAPHGPLPDPIDSGLAMDAPALVISTSGSSGTPKLIVHSLRSLAYQCVLNTVTLRADDRILAAAGPPGSYGGVRNLLAPLFLGAFVSFADIRQDGLRGFAARFRAEGITVFRAGTSLMRLLVALPDASAVLAGLRLVRCGGEPVQQADIRALRAVLPQTCRIENLYGATEGMIFHWTVPAQDDRDPVHVPAGFVDRDGEAAVLDAAGRLCGPGEVGELVVRGSRIAIGEWRDGRCVPGRLIPDPAAPGTRVYFTGDLARADPDGRVTVLGRIDRMLKINGQRVEPAEVEAAIRELADVVDVTVLARARAGVTNLIAFVVPGARGRDEIAEALRARLRRHLPAHMLPARIVALDAMPRLANGKVDAVSLLAGLGDG